MSILKRYLFFRQFDDNVFNLFGLYFEGRKDTTLVFKDRKQIVKEEHISIIVEPGKIYMGHSSVSSSNSKTVAVITIKTVAKTTLSKIFAVGCDGTVSNNGHNTGIIRQLE